jgi:hypothetical protein
MWKNRVSYLPATCAGHAGRNSVLSRVICDITKQSSTLFKMFLA